jgi:hypothetical protein
MLTVPNEVALTESRTMRAATIERTDVLTKVKALVLLPDNVHATTELVAAYFEVDVEAINSLVKRNRAELEENGLRKLEGADLREFVMANEAIANGISSRTRTLRLFTRRAILNVGQLLTESDIARQIRTYLLELEAAATPEQRSEAVERAELAEVQMRVLKAALGIVDGAWLELKARHVAAKALGEEPEIDPAARPLYVPDFLKSKGLTKTEIVSVQSWFGRRAAALYEAERGEKPGKRTEETSRGSVRETFAWCERDRPVFEETWERYYAAQYARPVQDGFELAGGAS